MYKLLDNLAPPDRKLTVVTATRLRQTVSCKCGL